MTSKLPLLQEMVTMIMTLTIMELPRYGHSIPRIHLGLYMMSRREAISSTTTALSLGYHGIDSAQMYHNEREAGTGIQNHLSSPSASKLNPEAVLATKREEIFYTSKLAESSTNYDQVRQEIKDSIKDAGVGYLDLFLLHSPYGGKQARLTSWKAVEDAVLAGEVKMGGVSNYGVKHIEELMASDLKVYPVINQIEVHPFNTQTAIRETCKKHDIAVEAYAPLTRGMRMKHPKVLELAGKYGCTAAQIFVRWGIQHDLIMLPKSVKPERMFENANVHWFEISEEDMKTLDGLDERLVTDWDPTECP